MRNTFRHIVRRLTSKRLHTLLISGCICTAGCSFPSKSRRSDPQEAQKLFQIRDWANDLQKADPRQQSTAPVTIAGEPEAGMEACPELNQLCGDESNWLAAGTIKVDAQLGVDLTNFRIHDSFPAFPALNDNLKTVLLGANHEQLTKTRIPRSHTISLCIPEKNSTHKPIKGCITDMTNGQNRFYNLQESTYESSTDQGRGQVFRFFYHRWLSYTEVPETLRNITVPDGIAALSQPNPKRIELFQKGSNYAWTGHITVIRESPTDDKPYRVFLSSASGTANSDDLLSKFYNSGGAVVADAQGFEVAMDLKFRDPAAAPSRPVAPPTDSGKLNSRGITKTSSASNNNWLFQQISKTDFDNSINKPLIALPSPVPAEISPYNDLLFPEPMWIGQWKPVVEEWGNPNFGEVQLNAIQNQCPDAMLFHFNRALTLSPAYHKDTWSLPPFENYRELVEVEMVNYLNELQLFADLAMGDFIFDLAQRFHYPLQLAVIACPNNNKIFIREGALRKDKEDKTLPLNQQHPDGWYASDQDYSIVKQMPNSRNWVVAGSFIRTTPKTLLEDLLNKAVKTYDERWWADYQELFDKHKHIEDRFFTERTGELSEEYQRLGDELDQLKSDNPALAKRTAQIEKLSLIIMTLGNHFPQKLVVQFYVGDDNVVRCIPRTDDLRICVTVFNGDPFEPIVLQGFEQTMH